jgi:hypothetical protein
MSFRRRTSETIAGLQRDLDTLKAQVAAAPPNASESAAGAPPASEATAEPDFAPPAPGTSLSDVHDQVKSLIEQVDGLDRRQLQDHERLSLRLEELTTQFTNQLLEIGGELDATHQRLTSQLAAQDQRFEELSSMASTNGNGSPDALIEELRTNQVRIANDLARHEIAVRQDLATLADLVSRSRSGGRASAVAQPTGSEAVG